MFIEIETDMCLKETAEAKNIREWIKGAYIDLSLFNIGPSWI